MADRRRFRRRRRRRERQRLGIAPPSTVAAPQVVTPPVPAPQVEPPQIGLDLLGGPARQAVQAQAPGLLDLTGVTSAPAQQPDVMAQIAQREREAAADAREREARIQEQHLQNLVRLGAQAETQPLVSPAEAQQQVEQGAFAQQVGQQVGERFEARGLPAPPAPEAPVVPGAPQPPVQLTSERIQEAFTAAEGEPERDPFPLRAGQALAKLLPGSQLEEPEGFDPLGGIADFLGMAVDGFAAAAEKVDNLLAPIRGAFTPSQAVLEEYEEGIGRDAFLPGAAFLQRGVFPALAFLAGREMAQPGGVGERIAQETQDMDPINALGTSISVWQDEAYKREIEMRERDPVGSVLGDVVFWGIADPIFALPEMLAASRVPQVARIGSAAVRGRQAVTRPVGRAVVQTAVLPFRAVGVGLQAARPALKPIGEARLPIVSAMARWTERSGTQFRRPLDTSSDTLLYQAAAGVEDFANETSRLKMTDADRYLLLEQIADGVELPKLQYVGAAAEPTAAGLQMSGPSTAIDFWDQIGPMAQDSLRLMEKYIQDAVDVGVGRARPLMPEFRNFLSNARVSGRPMNEVFDQIRGYVVAARMEDLGLTPKRALTMSDVIRGPGIDRRIGAGVQVFERFWREAVLSSMWYPLANIVDGGHRLATTGTLPWMPNLRQLYRSGNLYPELQRRVGEQLADPLWARGKGVMTNLRQTFTRGFRPELAPRGELAAGGPAREFLGTQRHVGRFARHLPFLRISDAGDLVMRARQFEVEYARKMMSAIRVDRATRTVEASRLDAFLREPPPMGVSRETWEGLQQQLAQTQTEQQAQAILTSLSPDQLNTSVLRQHVLLEGISSETLKPIDDQLDVIMAQGDHRLVNSATNAAIDNERGVSEAIDQLEEQSLDQLFEAAVREQPELQPHAQGLRQVARDLKNLTSSEADELREIQQLRELIPGLPNELTGVDQVEQFIQTLRFVRQRRGYRVLMALAEGMARRGADVAMQDIMPHAQVAAAIQGARAPLDARMAVLGRTRELYFKVGANPTELRKGLEALLAEFPENADFRILSEQLAAGAKESTALWVNYKTVMPRLSADAFAEEMAVEFNFRHVLSNGADLDPDALEVIKEVARRARTGEPAELQGLLREAGLNSQLGRIDAQPMIRPLADISEQELIDAARIQREHTRLGARVTELEEAERRLQQRYAGRTQRAQQQAQRRIAAEQTRIGTQQARVIAQSDRAIARLEGQIDRAATRAQSTQVRAIEALEQGHATSARLTTAWQSRSQEVADLRNRLTTLRSMRNAQVSSIKAAGADAVAQVEQALGHELGILERELEVRMFGSAPADSSAAEVMANAIRQTTRPEGVGAELAEAQRVFQAADADLQRSRELFRDMPDGSIDVVTELVEATQLLETPAQRAGRVRGALNRYRTVLHDAIDNPDFYQQVYSSEGRRAMSAHVRQYIDALHDMRARRSTALNQLHQQSRSLAEESINRTQVGYSHTTNAMALTKPVFPFIRFGIQGNITAARLLLRHPWSLEMLRGYQDIARATQPEEARLGARPYLQLPGGLAFSPLGFLTLGRHFNPNATTYLELQRQYHEEQNVSNIGRILDLLPRLGPSPGPIVNLAVQLGSPLYEAQVGERLESQETRGLFPLANLYRQLTALFGLGEGRGLQLNPLGIPITSPRGADISAPPTDQMDPEERNRFLESQGLRNFANRVALGELSAFADKETGRQQLLRDSQQQASFQDLVGQWLPGIRMGLFENAEQAGREAEADILEYVGIPRHVQAQLRENGIWPWQYLNRVQRRIIYEAIPGLRERAQANVPFRSQEEQARAFALDEYQRQRTEIRADFRRQMLLDDESLQRWRTDPRGRRLIGPQVEGPEKRLTPRQWMDSRSELFDRRDERERTLQQTINRTSEARFSLEPRALGNSVFLTAAEREARREEDGRYMPHEDVMLEAYWALYQDPKVLLQETLGRRVIDFDELNRRQDQLLANEPANVKAYVLAEVNRNLTNVDRERRIASEQWFGTTRTWPGTPEYEGYLNLPRWTPALDRQWKDAIDRAETRERTIRALPGGTLLARQFRRLGYATEDGTVDGKVLEWTRMDDAPGLFLLRNQLNRENPEGRRARDRYSAQHPEMRAWFQWEEERVEPALAPVGLNLGVGAPV